MRSPSCGRGIGDDQAAGGRIDAQGLDRRGVVVQRHHTARRRLAAGPRREVEVARTQGLDAGLEPRLERGEQRVEVDRAATRRLAQAGHRAGELRRKVAFAPVRVDPDADDHARVVRAEAVALAQHARELAQLDRRGEAGGRRRRVELADEQGVGPGHLDHEVVGPLEVDRARREPGDVLGGVAHRQRHRPREAPCPVRRQPRRPEAERREQRRPGGRRPGPAVPAAARRLLAGNRHADLRLAGLEPAAHDVVRRADAGEALDAGEHGRCGAGPGHVVSRRRRRPPRRSRAAPARTRRGARGPPPPRDPRR